MRFSRSLKSSAQALQSPNGAHIATLLAGKLSFRTTRSLEISRVVPISPELSASVCWFIWSQSSDRLLVASSETFRIFSVSDTQYSASITNPTSGTTKPVFVAFGSTHDEILSFSEFGLKLSVFNLETSKSVDISSPKLYNAGVASRGYSYRPHTLELALLTRTGGKDIISIHSCGGLEVSRSWYPETIDAQSISWSPDGRWLAVVESASQGYKVLMYTADGHLYKVWNGPIPTVDEVDLSLGAGVKMFEWNTTSDYVALGTCNNRVTVLEAPSLTEYVSLLHSETVIPSGSLQIWQEQVTAINNGEYNRNFVLISQTTCPPTLGSSSETKTDASVRSGANALDFDTSGTLLLTRVDFMPTTLWIWDIGTRVLRAILMLHASVAKVTWHPTIRELLMVRCEGEDNRGLVHLWDPSWQSPRVIDFALQLPGSKVLGKTIARWLQTDAASPAIFFSDTQDCILASVCDPECPDVPWKDAEAGFCDIYGQMEESPLNLVPGNGKGAHGGRGVVEALMEDDGMTRLSGSDEVDDTFRFRKFLAP